MTDEPAEPTKPKKPRRVPLEQLPIFASETEIAKSLLGPRWAMWRGLVPLLEREGLPKVDRLFGGRYVPAVKHWLDYRAGLVDHAVAADGLERPWRGSGTRRGSDPGASDVQIHIGTPPARQQMPRRRRRQKPPSV